MWKNRRGAKIAAHDFFFLIAQKKERLTFTDCSTSSIFINPEYFSRDKGDNLPSIDKESEAQWLSVLTKLIVQRSQVPPSASFVTGLFLPLLQVFGCPLRAQGLWQEALALLTQACSGFCTVQLFPKTYSLSFGQVLVFWYF